MGKSKKLIICVDGLGYDLISHENTPFLNRFKEESKLHRLETLFAFTGIEYGFFTGETPEKSKIWLEFSKSENSIFRNFIINFLSFSRRLKNYWAIILQLLNKRTYLCSLHNIPNNKIKYFDSSVKYGLWKLPFFQKRDFAFYKWPFFATKKYGKEKRKIIFKYESDEERIKRLIKDKGKEIYYTQLMEVDKTIHKFGKKSEKTKRILGKIDKLLEDISKKFLEEKNSEIIIWSDHGFADIKNYINLEKILPRRKDYLYFIAGTTVSFWFKNKDAKEEIGKILSSVAFLEKLTIEKAKKYDIPFSEIYGELIYFVKKGNYLFPNFYQKELKERFNAMHGYPNDKELDGFILFEDGKKVNKNLKIKDIFWSL